MRVFDRWLGVPACFLLSVFRRFRSLIPWPKPGVVRKLLFVKLVEQGTTVLAYPAIRHAVDALGAENVYFLVFDENRPIVDAIETIPPQNVVVIRSSNILGTLLSTLGAMWRMRRLGIDATVDLEFFARSSACLSYLSGARTRVGFHGFTGDAPYRGNLMTHPVLFNPHIHASEAFLTLTLAADQPRSSGPDLDLTVPDCEGVLPEFHPTEAEVSGVREMLGGGHAESQRVVVMNPNTGDLMPLRAWPTERYVELTRRVIETYPDVLTVFTGTKADVEAVGDLVGQVGSDRCRSLAGKTTMRELITLYTLSEAMVTNDSGPAHFAAMTAMDSIVLFGPETPKLFAARTPRTHVVWAGLVCSPCISALNNRMTTCRDNICMQRITVEQVFETLCSVLDSRAEPSGQETTA
jgi:ADP-heptose:LPS heptosyltransferase